MPKDAVCDRFDFRPIGAAIKKARMERELSRETLAEMCDISEGYVKAIENAGKNPGFQVFWKLVTMFNISVDEYFYSDRAPVTDSRRRSVLGMIREIGNDDVYIVESLVKGLSSRSRRTDRDADADTEGRS
jgi:transcriptional regulator with XRE-family HTH domain